MLNDARGFSRIIIACGKTDLRRGAGEKNVLFLFCGTKSDRIKGVVFEGDGYLLLYKRLSTGKFQWPRNQQEAMSITQEQFDWLMRGMTIVSTIRETKPKRLC